MPQPQTLYARVGQAYIAYQVIGEGPMDLVYAGSFVTQIDLLWDFPEIKRFLLRQSDGTAPANVHCTGGVNPPCGKVGAAELLIATGQGKWWKFGAPEEIRTPDPQIRSLGCLTKSEALERLPRIAVVVQRSLISNMALGICPSYLTPTSDKLRVYFCRSFNA